MATIVKTSPLPAPHRPRPRCRPRSLPRGPRKAAATGDGPVRHLLTEHRAPPSHRWEKQKPEGGDRAREGRGLVSDSGARGRPPGPERPHPSLSVPGSQLSELPPGDRLSAVRPGDTGNRFAKGAPLKDHRRPNWSASPPPRPPPSKAALWASGDLWVPHGHRSPRYCGAKRRAGLRTHRLTPPAKPVPAPSS